MQFVFMQLYEGETAKIEIILREEGSTIISKLMNTYKQRDLSNFIGIYLRIFSSSNVS